MRLVLERFASQKGTPNLGELSVPDTFIVVMISDSGPPSVAYAGEHTLIRQARAQLLGAGNHDRIRLALSADMAWALLSHGKKVAYRFTSIEAARDRLKYESRISLEERKAIMTALSELPAARALTVRHEQEQEQARAADELNAARSGSAN
jgi:hypothetical protein